MMKARSKTSPSCAFCVEICEVSAGLQLYRDEGLYQQPCGVDDTAETSIVDSHTHLRMPGRHRLASL